MLKTIFLLLFSVVFIFSFVFTLIIFYHFSRFKPLISLKEREILTFLVLGQIFCFLLTIFSFFFI